MSGVLQGAILPVMSNAALTVTVDPATYDLDLLQSAAEDGTSDKVAVIPYWTLDTVFPSGTGVQISSNRLLPKTQVLLFDHLSAGTNQSAAAVFFYFAGDGTYSAGWYRFGDMATKRGETRLPPARYFVVRHAAGTDTELLLTGRVQMAVHRVALETRAAGTPQDNRLGLVIPLPVTLDASGLHESGAFTSSPNRLLPVDQLLVYSNSSVGRNKSASAVYFYFAGNQTYSSGWYRFGDMSQSAGNVVLKPGEGFVIRKGATNPTTTASWFISPPYLQ